jgi:translocation and assembly module TamA
MNYFIPNFYNDSQTFDLKLEAIREELQPSFSDNLYEFSFKFSKTLTPIINYDLGIASRYYQVQHSYQNGQYALTIPYIKWRYDTTYSQLDPKTGIKAALGALYYQNLIHYKGYLSGTFKSAFFYSIWKKRVTFAERVFIGSFFTSDLTSIPVPLRFFGGTDEYLRGFRYYTVSPLHQDKPIGGKSCLYLNSEIRITLKYPFGTVLFYDSGFVSDRILPYQHSAYYQSLGFGFRYYAFFGPLRIDFGFPLNRRKALDSKFKVLGSFGHTF